MGGASLLTIILNFIVRKKAVRQHDIDVSGNKKNLKLATRDVLAHQLVASKADQLAPGAIYYFEDGFYYGIFGPKYEIKCWEDDICVSVSETFIGSILFPCERTVLNPKMVEGLAEVTERYQ